MGGKEGHLFRSRNYRLGHGGLGLAATAGPGPPSASSLPPCPGWVDLGSEMEMMKVDDGMRRDRGEGGRRKAVGPASW